MEVTYFLMQWEQCLCPVGLPALPWALRNLSDREEGLLEALSGVLRTGSVETQQSNLPGAEIGGLLSSTISNLSCWLIEHFPLLQSLTPTHSWGNSSVTNTSSSNIGRGSGSLIAMCCKSNRWQDREKMSGYMVERLWLIQGLGRKTDIFRWKWHDVIVRMTWENKCSPGIISETIHRKHTA